MQLLIIDHEGLCVQQTMTLLSCPKFTTSWISCALRRPDAERSRYEVQEIQRSVKNIMTHWTMHLQAFEITAWTDQEKTVLSSMEKNQKLEMGFRAKVGEGVSSVIQMVEAQMNTREDDRIQLQCLTPPFSQTGPVDVCLYIGGTCYSEAMSITAYDPQAWTIESIHPTCGHVNVAMPSKRIAFSYVFLNRENVSTSLVRSAKPNCSTCVCSKLLSTNGI